MTVWRSAFELRGQINAQTTSAVGVAFWLRYSRRLTPRSGVSVVADTRTGAQSEIRTHTIAQ